MHRRNWFQDRPSPQRHQNLWILKSLIQGCVSFTYYILHSFLRPLVLHTHIRQLTVVYNSCSRWSNMSSTCKHTDLHIIKINENKSFFFFYAVGLLHLTPGFSLVKVVWVTVYLLLSFLYGLLFRPLLELTRIHMKSGPTVTSSVKMESFWSPRWCCQSSMSWFPQWCPLPVISLVSLFPIFALCTLEL